MMKCLSKIFGVEVRTKSLNVFLALSVGILGTSLVTDSVLATLNATAFNTSATPISTDSLTIALSNGAGSSGFSNTFSGLVPGDSRTFYVNVTQGSSTSTLPKLTITDSAAANSLLTTDTSRGLAVTVNGCATAWSSGTCSGGSTVVLASTSLLTLKTTTALSNYTTTALGVNYLQFIVTLPPGLDETSANGAAAVVSGGTGTIQGLTANITWIISVQQRAATSTQA